MDKNFEEHLKNIVNENGMVLLKVKKEDLEDSISGLTQLFPVLNHQVIKGNGSNIKQAIIDSKELEKHFDTAITAMTMLIANMEG